MKESEVKAQFEKDVAAHELTVLLDQGVYRHLRYGKPGTGIDSFHIVTYPGGLLFRGDRGDYVFERLQDMFEFFRGKGGINPSYWGEKVTAQDKHSPIKAWSWETFKEEAREALEEYLADRCIPTEESLQIQEEFEDDVIGGEDHGREWHIEAIMEFDPAGHGHPFGGAWEWSCEEFSYQYIWCCFAIQRAIEVYGAERDRAIRKAEMSTGPIQINLAEEEFAILAERLGQ